ncbi:DNA polymerase III subunit delta [Candidatus Falkowbacteria bacterium]|nr:MAG: DNA polymerase III subunit delta [Candidatus Falkowbacteria bacterium]
MIIFLYGPDDFRAKQKINELREKFIKEVDPTGSSVVSIDGAKTTIDELSTLYRPASLFSKRRFITLSNIMNNKQVEILEELGEFLQKEKNNENILVIYEPNFVEKKIAGKNLIMKPGADNKTLPLNKIEKKLFDYLVKSQFVQFFDVLSGSDLTKLLLTMIKKNGVRISNSTLQLLTGLVGTDLWLLSQEINKLSAYALASGKEEATITDEMVKEMVSQSLIDGIFSLTDALGNRQASLAVKLFNEQIIGGAHPHYLLTMMLWQFKTLASVRQGLDSGKTSKELAKSLGLHPYVLEKSINQVRKFNLISLQNAINRLIDLDFKSKTGQGKLEELLPVVLVSL